MRARHPHIGSAKWLLWPTLIAGSMSAVCATLYAWLTFKFPEEAQVVFGGLGTVLLFASNAATYVLAKGRVRTWVGLRETPDPTSVQLIEASRELAQFPPAQSAINFGIWAFGSAVMAVAMRLWAHSNWETTGRLLMLGLIFGTFSTVLTHALMMLRARSAQLHLVGLGLNTSRLATAVPNASKGLERTVVTFIGLLVATSLLLTADVAVAIGRRGVETILAAPAGEVRVALAADIKQELILQLGLLCAVVIGFAVISSYFLGTALSEPMQKVAEEAEWLASGNLAHPPYIPAEHEVWALSCALSSMHRVLSFAVSRLTQASVGVGVTSEQLLEVAHEQEAGLRKQTSSLHETSVTGEELSHSARQIAESAQAVTDVAGRTLLGAEAAEAEAETFSLAMDRVKQDNRAIADSVEKLSKRVQQIGKIVRFINGIADRSDLLALNAELEGTKAGDVGRGFGQVASEMRRLAENVIESTREIESLITEIREATSAAVSATEVGMTATDQGAHLAEELKRSLALIHRLAKKTSNAVKEVSSSTQEQQESTLQLAGKLAEIFGSMEEGAALAKSTSAANAQLASLSHELQAAVNRFHLVKEASG